MDFSEDTDSRYQIADQSDPFVLETKAGTFGGVADTEDDGRFYYGGGSVLEDGSTNPEHYAAVPKELYEKGIVHPGQVFKITNPDNGESAFVVARDHGPHSPDPESNANKRGIDIAPHVAKLIDYHTDKPLLVDFRMHGVAPHPDLAAAGRLPVIMPHPGMPDQSPAPDDLSMAVADPGAAGNIPGVSKVTPIGALPDAQPDTGIPPEVLDESDAAPVNEDAADEVAPSPKGSGLSTIVFPGDKAIPKQRFSDGSVLFENGIHAYPDHVEREIGGRRYAQYPGQKPVNIAPTNSVLSQAIKLGISPVDKETGRTLDDKELMGKIGESLRGADLPVGTTGEDALKGLSTEQAARVKALAEYRLPTSTASLSRNTNPMTQTMVNRALLYNPEFNASEYDNRKKLMSDMMSGATAKNIRSLNTVIGHLDNLDKTISTLNNGDFTAYNTVDNIIKRASGDPRLLRFKTDATAVENEITTAFKGTGATDQEIKQWRDVFRASNSTRQLKASVDEAVKLIGSRVGAIQGTYKRGMDTEKTFPMLDPKPQEILTKMGHGDIVELAGGKVDSKALSPKEDYIYPDKTGQHHYQYKSGKWIQID